MASHRVVQFSDTHFLEEGATPEGGFAYDTAAAFDAVAGIVEAASEPLDLIVITGDVADHGRPAQYRKAAAAFSRFTVPVNACPGNHDQDLAFSVALGRPGLSTSRVVELGEWCHLFVDSNAGAMTAGPDGRYVDPEDYDDRLHLNGSLGAREAAWVRAAHDASEAPHVFVWVHHPPVPPVGLCADAGYAAEWRNLVPDLPRLRGIGAGHTHVPGTYDLAGVPVFMAPALKNNFDLDAATMLPPGCRSYRFDDDGAVASDVVLADDDRWPRAPVGRAVLSLLNGELSWAEFDAIVARKRAG